MCLLPTCPIVILAKKRKEHETDESEDNSDIEVLAASEEKWPGKCCSKTTVQKRVPRHMAVFRSFHESRLPCLLQAVQE